jgi:4-alpha-glucanotransferase
VLGADARQFVDFLAESGFSVWQVLPIGPVDHVGSPYAQKSAFAGNPRLIDPLGEQNQPWWPDEETDGLDWPGRRALIARAWQAFRAHADTDAKAELDAFFRSQRAWLMPYAVYTALHEKHEHAPWWEWPAGLRDRDTDELRAAMRDHRGHIQLAIFEQFLFDRQWRSLRDYANEQGVLLFGDMPFYVDTDSADVWWRRRCFKLADNGMPEEVAGVPPDYFSEDGQLWGNPVYDWDHLAENGFDWWLDRFGQQLRWFDLVRLDHFRALAACWTIPAGAETARDGRWVDVPGAELLTRVRERFGSMPLVAEDLGTITRDVTSLRDEFRIPGMLVLHFAFDGSPDNPYLPDNHPESAVVYTGTHDNDTTLGWYTSLDERTREAVDRLTDGETMPHGLIRAAMGSPAKLAVVPMQDILGLDSSGRMNTPGTAQDNWRWRFAWDDLDLMTSARLIPLIEATGR